jgi:general secretion pathway protein H
MSRGLPGASPGFTLIELLAAITIVGLVLTAAVPASVRLYQSMQYRGAVMDTISLLASARYRAINTGRPQDVVINPGARELRLNSMVQRLPEGVNVVVHSAGELNREDSGVIRFYPQGGSSGGGVDIEIPRRNGVRIEVDWLLGRVSQEKYALN